MDIVAGDTLFDHKIKTMLGYDGTGKIADILTVNGIPSIRKIMLFENISMLPLDITWSNSNGYFEFNGLHTNLKFTIIGIDYNNQYQPDVLMNVQPS